MSELYDRYHSVKERIASACTQAGRNVDSVQLIAVSKLQAIEAIQEVASFGQKDFGENYIQEALEKIAIEPNLNWHAIGPVQSKKTKDIIGKFHTIHSLATPSFLAELQKRIPQDSVQNVLLQINIGCEEQKSGIMPEDALDFTKQALEVPSLNVCGLMCLPPFFGDQEKSRPYFVAMRELRDKLEQELAIKLPHLSMGMSDDFVAAIEEGATIIRVGSDIFGARPQR